MRMQTCLKALLCSTICFWLLTNGVAAQNIGFTQDDRERLIRLETTLELFMQQTNQRFEQVDKRFTELRDDTNKRFEQIDKRFEELRADTNKRFEELMSFLWMLVGIFTALVIAVIGFAWWDRRSSIQKAQAETIAALDRLGIGPRLVQALREFAAEEPRLARSLRTCGLL